LLYSLAWDLSYELHVDLYCLNILPRVFHGEDIPGPHVGLLNGFWLYVARHN
jgi:hypothetical protein